MCDEAGPSGYVLKRQLESMGVKCVVVVAAELTGVWTPSGDDEALRDLIRAAREDSKEDLLRAERSLVQRGV